MARPIGESTFTAPIARQWASETTSEEFERALLGFCVSSILDQRAADGENRTFWAGRLGLSKSHISKMTESPTAAFIERFVLELRNIESDSHPRLKSFLSDFYADIRPPDRHQPTRAVLKWYARYQPPTSAHLTRALFMSEVALEKCRMLERAGGAEYDAEVRDSMRELIVVTSGPYGGSVISLHQCAELGLQVPTAFFEEIEQTLNTSPLGFRTLRTLDRFVRLWRSPGPAHTRQRQQGVETHLPKLIGRISSAVSEGWFLDPYPGREWGTALAGECLKADQPDLVSSASSWLMQTIANTEVSARGRLHAAWVLGCARPQEHENVLVKLVPGDQTFLERWRALLPQGWSALGQAESSEDEVDETQTSRAATTASFNDAVEHEFRVELTCIRQAVESTMAEEMYDGNRRSLTSLLFAALVTPDGRHRRALIEAVANAGLVAPTAEVLCRLLGLDESDADDVALVDDGLRETAIFLLGRLRMPKNAARIKQVTAVASGDRSQAVRHAAVWAIGDLWSKDLEFDSEVLGALRSIATSTDDDVPWATRVAAAHVLAIMAHDEEHRPVPEDGCKLTDVQGVLVEVHTAWAGRGEPGALSIQAICYWGMRFDQHAELDIRRVQTMSGLLDGNVTQTLSDLPKEHDFRLEQHPVGS